MSHISKEEYLKEDFDYTKLTKQELRLIMLENNVVNIPPINALKHVIIEAYEAEIHKRIKELSARFKNKNIFQSSREEETETDKKSDGNIDKRNNGLVADLISEMDDKTKNKNKSVFKGKLETKIPFNEKIHKNSYIKDESFSNSQNDFISHNSNRSILTDKSFNNSGLYNVKNCSDKSFSESNRNNKPYSNSLCISTATEDEINEFKGEQLASKNGSFINTETEDEIIKSNRNNKLFSNSLIINKPTEDEINKLKTEQLASKNIFKIPLKNKMSEEIFKEMSKEKINEMPKEKINEIFNEMPKERIKQNQKNTKIVDSLKSLHENKKSMIKYIEDNSFVSKSKDVINTTTKLKKIILRFLKWSTRIFLIMIVALYVYLRFFCPYCGTVQQRGLCVPLPRNTYLDKNNKLVIKKGYKLVKSFINYCSIDNSELTEKNKKINTIVKMLEQIRGKQNYGFDKHLKITLDSLIDSDSLRFSLLNDKRLIIENGFVRARRGTVTLRILLKYYFFKLSKIALPVLLGMLFVKYLLYERKKNQMFYAQANSIAREVFDVLMRQLISSSKTTIFKNYVYELQLKEALEIKDYIWKTVKRIVEANSNVLTEQDEMKKIKWSWIGPIIKKDLVLDN